MFQRSGSWFAAEIASNVMNVATLQSSRKRDGCRPLPLRERAAQIFDSEERGSSLRKETFIAKKPPHPSMLVAPPSCPLPQGQMLDQPDVVARAKEALES